MDKAQSITMTGPANNTYLYVNGKGNRKSGGVTSSTAIALNVNAPPTVGITAPANNANYVAPASITLTANASETNGTIARVEFFNGASLIGTATAAPYTVS